MHFGSRVRAVLLTPLFAAAGCLLTSDFDGIVGVRPAAEDRPEGGAPIVDAGSEITIGPAACSDAGHTFCTEFDDVDAAAIEGWQIVERGLGKVALDATSSVSAPNSMSMFVSGDSAAGAFLLREVSVGSFKSVKLTFDFRLIDCDAQQKNSLTFVYLGVSATVAYGFVMLSSGGLALGSVVGGNTAFYPFDKNVQKNAWTRLAFTVTPKTGTTAHLNLTVNGQRSVDTDAPTGPPASTLKIELGVQGDSAPTGCRVSYDNVAFDEH